MQNFPNPNDFDDWRSWASEMQKQVEQESKVGGNKRTT